LSANLNKLALEVRVDPEHGSNAGDPERFRTARWSAILVAAQNFASDEAAILRQEIGCIVSDPADIDQEFHALCDALVAAEVWL
jgi:hypothetical protein